jgi:hypothetical protein
MKNIIKLLGFAALVAVIVFTMIACDTGGGGGGSRKNPTPTPTPSGTRDPVTYAGMAGSYTYVLIIEDSGAARAVLTPEKDDKYTLIYGNSRVSTGDVVSFENGVLTLAPSKAEDPEEETFTITVSGAGITGMTGTITWDNGNTNEAPSTLTQPSSDGQKTIAITGVIEEVIELTGFNIAVYVQSKDGKDFVAGNERGIITNGVVIVDLYTQDNEAYTGSASNYVGIGSWDDGWWYITKEKINITQTITVIPWAKFEEWK